MARAAGDACAHWPVRSACWRRGDADPHGRNGGESDVWPYFCRDSSCDRTEHRAERRGRCERTHDLPASSFCSPRSTPRRSRLSSRAHRSILGGNG